MSDAAPPVPTIADEDIDWVCDLMGLEALDAPRRNFLKASSTLDVSACPGSGKTTLIIAKLAILARKWQLRTKGICVLSHTNVAREEIERRLGDTVVGQQILSYPHFIDTIHGFVNRFLALPWLNSNGYPPPTVDDDVASAFRRGALRTSDYWAVQNFLTQKYSDFDRVRICDRDLHFDLGGKPFPAKADTKSFKLTKEAVETSAQEGYFCYDEMFVWARALLEDFPDIACWLQKRFPLVIVDEMQDTRRVQSDLLEAVFPYAASTLTIQRVGDPNQEIFDTEVESEDSSQFPTTVPGGCLDIPNSFRFGSEIASLASPFAVRPVGTGGLRGMGAKKPASAPARCPHSIIVFPGDSTDGVLDAYGSLVLATFDDAALLEGAVTAVGTVHKDAPDVPPGHKQYPKTVPHYWSGYSADTSRKEPHPKSMVQYVRVARAAITDTRNFAPGVEKVASGIIRLARLIGDAGHVSRSRRTHKSITDALSDDEEALALYDQVVKSVLMDGHPLTKPNWVALRSDMLAVCRALCQGDVNPSRANEFLAWPQEDTAQVTPPATSQEDPGTNIYRVKAGDRQVDIRLGSVHSVKGQTHLATLLVSTYWHDHSSEKMMPWLVGERTNGKGAGIRDKKRLLQTYVAMTRPSHLVCLAIPRFALGDGETVQQRLACLTDRGWNIVEVDASLADLGGR